MRGTKLVDDCGAAGSVQLPTVILRPVGTALTFGPAGGQVCSSQLRGPVQARKGADLPRI